MYRALESFSTKNYDVRRKQILEEDFTTQDEIDEFLSIGYIEVYDGTIEITENGLYDVKDYDNADVDVAGETPTGEIEITENGTYDVTNYASANVDVPSGGIVLDGTLKFGQSYQMEELPEWLINADGWNNYTTMKALFYNCAKLKKVPSLDTSNVTDMEEMFQSCQELTEIGPIDMKNVTTAKSMFASCITLPAIPQLNNITNKISNVESMFRGCRVITTIPNIDTSGVTNMRSMFYDCYALINLPLLNTSSVKQWDGCFLNCRNLSATSLNNILQMCINATSYTGTKTLYYLGLRSNYYPAATIETLPNYQDFIDAGWTIGY